MTEAITNAAKNVILPLIDNTYTTGGGPYSIGATVVRAGKGRVGEVLKITDSNRENILGKPLPKSVGQHMEGLRHLADACAECSYVNVVRVVADDAKFPSISVQQIVDRGAWSDESVTYHVNDVVDIAGPAQLICVTEHTTVSEDPEPTAESENWDAFTTPAENDSHAYGTELSIGAGYAMQFYPVDGDPSLNRSVKIVPIVTYKGSWIVETNYAVNDVVSLTGGEKLICVIAHESSGSEPSVGAMPIHWKVFGPTYQRFKIEFYDKNDLNEKYLLESHIVGVGVDDRDDMGRPAFIETVLSEQSTRFGCIYNSSSTWDAIQDSLAALTETQFVGGTNGGEPTSQNWKDAWDMFRDENVPAFLMFAAGNYDETVLANCIEIADARHVSFFYDVSPLLNPENTLAWQKSSGLSSRQGGAYYCPYAATDAWYGGKTVWGCSGDVVAACARGDAMFTGDIPGVHYSPAGPIRATLGRVGITTLYQGQNIDRDEFYDARINPVIPSSSGSLVIDDAVSLHFQQNYSRFIWVNRIGNYIIYRFVEIANQLKHQPDRLTASGLQTGMNTVMAGLVTSGALSSPRNPEIDGNAPYTINVTQVAIDHWQVEWAFCPTGSARRIVGQPMLIF